MTTDGAAADLSLLAAFALIALLGAALWWLRGRGAAAGSGAIRLIANQSLGGKRLLALVEVGSERFLLGMTDEHIACLGRLAGSADGVAESAETASATAPPGGEEARTVKRELAAHRRWPASAALIALLATVLAPRAALAAAPHLSLEIGGGGEGLSTTIQLVLLFTLLSFAPAILIGVSAFVRIVIVLSFVRQAVGTHQMPPNQVIMGLALFLTFFVMMPTLQQVNRDAVVPYLEESLPAAETIAHGFQPLRAFMLRQTREKDLALFLGIAGRERPATQADVPPEIVIPAFMISELKTAFQISFMIYVPFLVLDMVVASILTSMGMITLPPVLISLPFKLMIFVLVDGWNLLVSSLMRSFQ